MLETSVYIHKNTEAKQYRARIVLGWMTAWELLVLLTKNQSRVLLREHISQADRGEISFKAYRLWGNLYCVSDCLLAITVKRSLRILAT